MKKYSLLFVGLFLLSSLVGFGQNKIGYINSTDLLQLMPERKTAEEALEKEALALQKQLQTMSTEYQSKLTDFQSNQATMSDLMKETKVKELTDLETRIKAFQESAQGELQKKEAELLEPILKKARAAVKTAATKSKYTHVFDTASGILIHAPDGDDMLPLVKKELGL